MSDNSIHLNASSLPVATAMDSIKHAAMEGAADARETANRVWNGASLFLFRFAYTTTYTISYGVVFPTTLLARAIPRDNAAVRGLIDGAKAATDRVHQLRGVDAGISSPVSTS